MDEMWMQKMLDGCDDEVTLECLHTQVQRVRQQTGMSGPKQVRAAYAVREERGAKGDAECVW